VFKTKRSFDDDIVVSIFTQTFLGDREENSLKTVYVEVRYFEIINMQQGYEIHVCKYT